MSKFKDRRLPSTKNLAMKKKGRRKNRSIKYKKPSSKKQTKKNRRKKTKNKKKRKNKTYKKSKKKMRGGGRAAGDQRPPHSAAKRRTAWFDRKERMKKAQKAKEKMAQKKKTEEENILGILNKYRKERVSATDLDKSSLGEVTQIANEKEIKIEDIKEEGEEKKQKIIERIILQSDNPIELQRLLLTAKDDLKVDLEYLRQQLERKERGDELQTNRDQATDQGNTLKQLLQAISRIENEGVKNQAAAVSRIEEIQKILELITETLNSRQKEAEADKAILDKTKRELRDSREKAQKLEQDVILAKQKSEEDQSSKRELTDELEECQAQVENLEKQLEKEREFQNHVDDRLGKLEAYISESVAARKLALDVAENRAAEADIELERARQRAAGTGPQ